MGIRGGGMIADCWVRDRSCWPNVVKIGEQTGSCISVSLRLRETNSSGESEACLCRFRGTDLLHFLGSHGGAEARREAKTSLRTIHVILPSLIKSA